MPRIKISLAYDGTNYSGWQIQKNTPHTIQQVLQEALSKLNKAPVYVTGAGRTDAGVHASGQVAVFELSVPVPVSHLPQALNRLLPEDIVCQEAEIVDSAFHPRYDARGKLYRYRIINQTLPPVFRRNYVYHYIPPLNLDKMRQAAACLKGKHDFASFMSSGSSMEDTVRTVKLIKITDHRPEVWLEVEGDGFLYNMVRIMAGTLIEVGAGKLPVNKIPEILESCDRTKAGFTAPARGLILLRVDYT